MQEMNEYAGALLAASMMYIKLYVRALSSGSRSSPVIVPVFRPEIKVGKPQRRCNF